MRRTPLKPGRTRPLSAQERKQAKAFRRAAANEPCVVCGAHPDLGTLIGLVDAHHVVAAQWLRRNAPDKVYDPRNALPVCRIDHERHENASRRIPLTALTEDNWEFAREVLGDYADDYLARYYAA